MGESVTMLPQVSKTNCWCECAGRSPGFCSRCGQKVPGGHIF